MIHINLTFDDKIIKSSLFSFKKKVLLLVKVLRSFWISFWSTFVVQIFQRKSKDYTIDSNPFSCNLFNGYHKISA